MDRGGSGPLAVLYVPRSGALVPSSFALCLVRSGPGGAVPVFFEMANVVVLSLTVEWG